MRYTLHAPGAVAGDITQVGWNSGRRRKNLVNIPAAGGSQPATPIAYLAHTRAELVASNEGIQGGLPITPAAGLVTFHDWTGDCYAVCSPEGVIADITSEEERSPEWNSNR